MRIYEPGRNGPRKPVGEYSGEFGQRLAKLTDDALDEMAYTDRQLLVATTRKFLELLQQEEKNRVRLFLDPSGIAASPDWGSTRHA